ncbi:MAG TPA: DUF1016 family protein [Sulfurospirillum arcachonense]|nr:DUF1016 family protein [Sulfurospirillum arcachonense]
MPNIKPKKNISTLYNNIKTIIDTSKQEVTIQLNNTMVLSYWEIGKQLNVEILKDERATYGKEICATLSRKLSWSHFIEFIKVKDELKREFYIVMCAKERWNVRTLRERVNSMLFERYFFFRMLFLIDLCLMYLNEEENFDT